MFMTTYYIFLTAVLVLRNQSTNPPRLLQDVAASLSRLAADYEQVVA